MCANKSPRIIVSIQSTNNPRLFLLKESSRGREGIRPTEQRFNHCKLLGRRMMRYKV
jgi:hypothetical protein